MWFVQLPLPLQLTIIITVVLVIIGMSLIGKVSIRLGWNKLSFGRTDNKPGVKAPGSCSDCRKLIMTRTMKFDADINKVRNCVLRDQMNYAEQKLQEMAFQLSSTYREDIVNNRLPGASIDVIRENKEYILYQEALANSLLPIKNEIRRSLKENGFIDMSAPEFTDYIKNKTKLLITMGQEYIRSRYPFENMIVKIQDRFNQTPEEMIEGSVNDFYTKAKQMVLDANEKMDEIGEEFDKDMEELGK